MSLATFQQTLKTLFLTDEGRQALESADAYARFIEQSGLTPEEQQDFLKQPFKRLTQYQHMLCANVEGAISAMMPITEKLLEDSWEQLTEAYFYYDAHASYKFLTLAEGFPQFLNDTDFPEKARYPFVHELAYYEWVEAFLLSEPDPVIPADVQAGRLPASVDDLERMSPVLNPVATLLQLDYPIPALVELLQDEVPDQLPAELLQPSPNLVWAYRDPDTLACRFFQLNMVLAYWLSQALTTGHVQDSDLPTYLALAEPLYEQLHQANPQLLRETFLLELLNALRPLADNRILMGSLLQNHARHDKKQRR